MKNYAGFLGNWPGHLGGFDSLHPLQTCQICRHQRSVSAEMALKLGRLFNVSPELWMGIQADYDLEVARLQSRGKIERRVQPLAELQPA